RQALFDTFGGVAGLWPPPFSARPRKDVGLFLREVDLEHVIERASFAGPRRTIDRAQDGVGERLLKEGQRIAEAPRAADGVRARTTAHPFDLSQPNAPVFLLFAGRARNDGSK